MLYQLRYRTRHEVLSAYIEAGSPEKAGLVGRVWCNLNSSPDGSFGQKKSFISVQAAVVADESILIQPAPAPSAETEWMLLSAIERIARTTGKTEDEVREELRSRGKPKLAPPPEAEAPAGVMEDVRSKLRQAVGLKP